MLSSTRCSLPSSRWTSTFALEVKRSGLNTTPSEPLSGTRTLLRNQTSVGRRVKVNEGIGPFDKTQHRGGIFSSFGANRRALLRHHFFNSRCGIATIALSKALDSYLLVLVRLGLHHACLG